MENELQTLSFRGCKLNCGAWQLGSDVEPWRWSLWLALITHDTTRKAVIVWLRGWKWALELKLRALEAELGSPGAEIQSLGTKLESLGSKLSRGGWNWSRSSKNMKHTYVLLSFLTFYSLVKSLLSKFYNVIKSISFNIISYLSVKLNKLITNWKFSFLIILFKFLKILSRFCLE